MSQMSRPTTPAPSLDQNAPNPIDRLNASHSQKPSSFPKSHRPHLPHHAHRSHHHQHHEKAATQSAVQPTSHNPFGEFLSRSTSRTLPESGITGANTGAGIIASPLNQIHNASSALSPGSGDVDATTAATTTPRDERAESSTRTASTTAQFQKQKWARVNKLRAARTQVETDLHSTLSSLSTLSTATTRRLDYIYFALSQSLSSLRTGIHTLHELSKSTHALSSHFRSRTGELADENANAIQTAEKTFDRQASRIGGLEDRLRKSRERVKGFEQRLEAVREIVEECRARESEGTRRRKGWWRGCLGALCAILLAMALLSVLKGGEGGEGPKVEERFWDQEMRNGTLGAESLKQELEALRDGTTGSEGLEDGMVNGSVEEHYENPSGKGSLGGTPTGDAEATLRLLDDV